jgi:hypothetical protein
MGFQMPKVRSQLRGRKGLHQSRAIRAFVPAKRSDNIGKILLVVCNMCRVVRVECKDLVQFCACNIMLGINLGGLENV